MIRIAATANDLRLSVTNEPIPIIGQQSGHADQLGADAIGDGDHVLDRKRVVQRDVHRTHIGEVQLLDVGQRVRALIAAAPIGARIDDAPGAAPGRSVHRPVWSAGSRRTSR